MLTQIEGLQQHTTYLSSIRPDVIENWLDEKEVLEALQPYLPTQVFQEHYAHDIYTYFLDVIKQRVEIGDCPSIRRFLEYCSTENMPPDQLHIICSGLRKSLVSRMIKEPFFSTDIYQQITYITDQNFAGVMKVYSDLLEKNKLEIEKKNLLLHKQLYFDELTSLKNIYSLQEDLQTDTEQVLMIFDINRLHEINDSYGFDAGDMILIQFADLLNEVFEPYNAEVYRIVGDEFGVLIKKEMLKDMNLNKLAQKFHSILIPKRFLISDDEDAPELAIQITIGLSDVADLLINASSALHIAKSKNKIYYAYDQKSNRSISKNINSIQDIYNAILSAKVVAHFQPIVDTQTQKISKYETLMRMLDEDNNPISPIHFLDAAKRARLYPLLTTTIMNQACSMFNHHDAQFSINIERDDITNTKTRKHILNMVNTFSDPSRMIFELVESELLDNDPKISDFLKLLKRKGCKLAIDDFGSGFSNFEYLLHIQADIIKIDGSLIKDVDKSAEKRSIVKSIVTFAQDIGIETVAEYVATEDIYKIVKEMGITYSQGYYFAEPKPTLLS